MALPVITYEGTQLVGLINPAEGGGNQLTFTHPGGDILCVWLGGDGVGAPPDAALGAVPTTLSNIGGIAAIPLALTHNWAGRMGMRAWRYPAVPAGGRSIFINAPLDLIGAFVPFAVTNWAGAISPVTVGPTNGVVDLSHDVVITANDVIVGLWSQTGGVLGTLTPASGTLLTNASHGQVFDLTGNYSTGPNRYTTVQKTGTGNQTVSVTPAGWSAPLGLSCAFALLGTSPRAALAFMLDE